VVQGYYQYHAVPGNTPQLRIFQRRVNWLRRSALAEPFDDRLIAIDEFHHVAVNDDNRLGSQLRKLLKGIKYISLR
jgi:hypothetical protein